MPIGGSDKKHKEPFCFRGLDFRNLEHDIKSLGGS